jgi:hypothetical protein
MSTCRDRRCTAAAHVTATQARDASKYFSVAPYHVSSCIESEGTLYYLSRLVYGLPTFYSGEFSKSIPKNGNHANTIKMVWPKCRAILWQLCHVRASARFLADVTGRSFCTGIVSPSDKVG